MSDLDSFALNIAGVSDLIENATNKVTSSSNLNPEGVSGEKLDALDLPMTDKELLDLRDEWEKAYAPYEGKITPIFKRNLRSYLGRLKDGSLPDDETPVAANLQFEAEETFLPSVFAQQPSPFVFADNSPEGNKISTDVQTMLQFHADQLLLNRKLSAMVRQWSIYQLGVLKPGWNMALNDVAVENRKIQDYIFDPNGFVDAYGDFTSWLGERVYGSATKLIELYPKHKEYITTLVDNKMGTEVCWTEWWTDEYCFTTFKEKVLEKHKNQYFNYPDTTPDELTGVAPTPKRNHFANPKKPFVFMSVFSLMERPHDITGLIEQNIPNQNKITRRTEQIDANLSQSNNGILFSENNFNQETAKQAANAITKGVGKVLIPPGGPISEAVVRLDAPSFPEAAFSDLENSENNLRSSWGTQGMTSQPPKPDETARGMIMNQNRDTSRIGGGIGEVVEQAVARNIFNWLVQLYMVFYDEKHFGAVMGSAKATEYVELSSQSIDRQLIVGVAPNSMKAKDEVSKMNQATQLYQAGAIGPKTYLEALDFPNADDAASDGALWQVDKMAYIQMNFPELMQKLQQYQQQQQAQQAQAQQQQLQLQAAQGDQQLQQKGAVAQQQIQQGAQVHAQKLQQGHEIHQQKLQQSTEAASAKLAAVPVPK